MSACLRGAVLELETHFSLLKINTSHAPPSWFSRGDTHPKSIINKRERDGAHSLNCWRMLSLFSATIMTKLHFCEFGLPPPFLSIPSPSGNIWIIHEWGWLFAHKWFLLPHKFFGEVLCESLRLEMIYWWSGLEIFSVTTRRIVDFKT